MEDTDLILFNTKTRGIAADGCLISCSSQYCVFWFWSLDPSLWPKPKKGNHMQSVGDFAKLSV
jgi:hypothetical protein